jgi:hypothetical protein
MVQNTTEASDEHATNEWEKYVHTAPMTASSRSERVGHFREDRQRAHSLVLTLDGCHKIPVGMCSLMPFLTYRKLGQEMGVLDDV